MEFLIYAIIGIVILVRFLLSQAKQGQPGNLSAPGGNKPNSLLQQLQNLQAEAEKRRSGNPRQVKTPPPVPQNTIADHREEGHFRESSLVEEFQRTRMGGRQIRHHTHDYFDEKTDRKTAGSHVREHVSKHPYANLLRKKGGLKRAVAMSEILKRKF